MKCNVLEWKELRRVFSKTKKNHGHIDIVYANAGIVTGLDAFDDKLDEDGELLEPNMGVIDVCLKSVIASQFCHHLFLALCFDDHFWLPYLFLCFNKLMSRAASKLALSYFKSNPTPGGSLILTCSAAGYNPRPNIVLYSAAKTGVCIVPCPQTHRLTGAQVAGFLRALHQFVEPHSGITVNAVAPGPTGPTLHLRSSKGPS